MKRNRPLILLLFLLLVFDLLVTSSESYALWEWQDFRKRHKRERQSKKFHLSDGTKDISENEVEPIKETPTLNVSSKDSPYALIDRFFPERESNRRFFNDNGTNLGNLPASEVWLSDGDLLVLKGGTTPNRKAFDEPWSPLDDYVAPYREPKLPPPDFIPSDTGVGLPLPQDEEEEVKKEEPKRLTLVEKRGQEDPFRTFLFDEEKLIARVENFHSKRRDELLNSIDVLKVNLVQGNTLNTIPEPKRTLEYLVNTTPIPDNQGYFANTTPLPDNQGYYVTTSTPNSYAYAYQTENSPSRARSTTQSTTTTTQATITSTTIKTTTPTPVRQLKPREPKSYFRTTIKPFKPTPLHHQHSYHLNEVDVDNKVAEERHDHFYLKRNHHNHWNKNNRIHYNPNNPRARRKIPLFPGPTLATSVISSLKPRLSKPFYYPHIHHRGNRKPLVHTPSQTRRISHGSDHRYVSFYRGQQAAAGGGQPSWTGYSYHL